jgi:glycosyltransferase involved in cell wall biosynthesis
MSDVTHAPPPPRAQASAPAGHRNAGHPVLSIVVPVYDERQVLSEFHERLSAVLDALGTSAEILYVDDGSRDGSFDLIAELQQHDRRLTAVRLSRNFGKEVAVTAGLDHCQGEAAVIIDADLQHPPELIPSLVEQWRAGFDVVYARRIERQGETALKKLTAKSFYRLMERLSEVPIPADAGDYRLLSRRAVDVLVGMRERHRFMKGLFAWIGFPQTSVPYRQQPRHAGETKWSYWRLWNFALEGITSFTTVPLRLASYVGALSALTAVLFAAWIVFKTLVWGDPVPGYPSLMVVVLFLGGVQLAALGVIGEYLGRTYNEVKHRPLYVIDTYRPGRLVDGDAAPARPGS